MTNNYFYITLFLGIIILILIEIVTAVFLFIKYKKNIFKRNEYRNLRFDFLHEDSNMLGSILGAIHIFSIAVVIVFSFMYLIEKLRLFLISFL